MSELLKLDRVNKMSITGELKNISICLERDSRIGVRMTRQESRLLFDLITEKQLPSSGLLENHAVCLRSKYAEDELYEKMTVQEYLHFFQCISGQQQNLVEMLPIFSVQDIFSEKIKNLTFDQKQRVHLLRIYIEQPDLVLLESPLQNLTHEGIELYLRSLVAFENGSCSFLITASYHEELLLLTEQIYRYMQGVGLEKLEILADENVEEGLDEVKLAEDTAPVVNVFKVACKLADKTVFFAPNEIDYIESLAGNSVLHVGQESFATNVSLNDLELKLANLGFFRCHRSYLVNMQRISELISYSRNSYTLILKGGNHEKIPLSRSRLEEMRELLDF